MQYYPVLSIRIKSHMMLLLFYQRTAIGQKLQTVIEFVHGNGCFQ